jgi:hypothetical protein
MSVQAAQIENAVAAYAAAWNEPDALARTALLARAVADDVRLITGGREVAGRAALSAEVDSLHRATPGVRVRLTSVVEVLGNLCRFAGVAERADGSKLGEAFDTCACDETGRLRTVITFPTVPRFGG